MLIDGIGFDVAISTSKKRKEVRDSKPTKTIPPKLKGVEGKKHISVKQKRDEVTKGPNPEAESLT